MTSSRAPVKPGRVPLEVTSGVTIVVPLTRDLAILACAASAGIHAAMTPEHLDEGTGAGLGFLGAAVLAAALAAGMTFRPESRVIVAAAGVVLAT